MAERRMFSKSVIDDDKFIDMKISAQYLYFHLAMRADDDGFVNGTKRIIRMIKCKEKDLDELIENGFVIAFESGVIAIRHWRLHNSIQKDRYKPTVYQEEKDTLSLEGGVYNPADNMDTECIQSVSLSETQVSIGKVSIGEVSVGEGSGEPEPKTQERFQPPATEDVAAYCSERNNGVNPQRFVDYYTANGWKIGRNKMKDWKAAVRSWEKNGISENPAPLIQQENHGSSFNISDLETSAMNRYRKIRSG